MRLRTIGTVKSLATVAIRPRVGGQLTEVFFKEGDYVKKGQKLFTIDPRPYEAAVKQAEANMAKNDALLKGAELELKRAETGAAQRRRGGDGVRRGPHRRRQRQGRRRGRPGRAQHRELQAGFTTITSPLDGRAGELLVAAGNLVDANGTSPLVVINQISPISVAFALPEQHLPVVVEARKKGPLKVEADLRGGGPLAPGEAGVHRQRRRPAHRHRPVQGRVRERRPQALAGAVRGRRR